MLPKKDSPCAPALPRATMVSNITAFIESVRPHPYLYDKSQPEFKDAALKDERWAVIADEYGITAVQAQKKWRNLKDKYVRLKKKMYLDGLVVCQSGLSNGSVPKAKWAFYDILDGILCNIYDTVTITPAPSLQATVVESPYNAIAEGMLDSMIKWQEHHLADMAVPPTPQPPLSATCATSSGIRKRKPAEVGTSTTTAAAATNSTATTSSSATTTSDTAEKRPREADEMHHYCLYLASRLRRLSNRGRIQAINDIQSAMFQIEMKETTRYQHTSKMAFNIRDTQELNRAMMMSKSQKIQDYMEEMRVMQYKSYLRNTALLQRLKDLEEKVKESSLKTEHLKLLREEARKKNREAALSSKPPIPRKKSQVNSGPLTSTPYQFKPIRRSPGDDNFSMSQSNQRMTTHVGSPPTPEHSGDIRMEYPNYLETMNTFSTFRSNGNLFKNLSKATKISPIQDYNARHASVLSSNPKIQRKGEKSVRSLKMSSDIGGIPGSSSYKTNSQKHSREDFHEISEELSVEELTSNDEEQSDDSLNDTNMFAKKDILEDAEIEFKMASKAKSAIKEKINTKAKLVNKTKNPPKVRFLENMAQENSPTDAASEYMQAEVTINAEPLMNVKVQEISKISNATKSTSTNISNATKTTSTKIGNELPNDIIEAEVEMPLPIPVAVEISINAENSEMQGKRIISLENENIIQDLSAPIEDNVLELEELEISNPTGYKILTNSEHLVEHVMEDNVDVKLVAKKELVNEENRENDVVSEASVENSDNLTKIPEYDKPEITKNQEPSKIFETGQLPEKGTVIDSLQEKSTGGILSFLSSDDDDDDDEDSFFDSIPKPHATAIQERMPEPKFVQHSTTIHEEISDPLSDDVDSDIDHQLATLVTPTDPIRFVEHEMAQSKQDFQKEENTPSEIPQKDKTTKDAKSERSTESGLTSQPLQVQAEKQPNQKLHQKLAIHLGLDTKTTFEISKPDLKKDDNEVEEDDFDFYD